MFKKLSEVSVSLLRARATAIHYFGLGFVQVKLGETYRMHFYTESLPAIVGDEDVHNHRYDFSSKVLYGDFYQEIYTVTDGDSHLRELESCKEGILSQHEPIPCSIRKAMRQHFPAGSSYSISHDVFHTVKASSAITFLERGPIAKDFAEVIRPLSSTKVCPFSKKIPEQELWNTVGEMLTIARKLQ